jgi:uncharacterized protein (TIGR03546 family)
MFRGLVISAGKLRADLSQHRTPDKIAMGVAMGSTLGFLPMDNLVWALLFVGVLFLPVHQLSAFAAWLFVGLLSSYLSVLPNALGDWLLTWDVVRWLAVRCHGLPMGAWFRLNNTLVLGSLSLGVMMLISNWLARRVFVKQTSLRKSSYIFDRADEPMTVYRKIGSMATQLETQQPAQSDSALLTNNSSAIAIASIEAPNPCEMTVSVASPTRDYSLRMDPPHTDPPHTSSHQGLHEEAAWESHNTGESDDIDQVTIRETFIEVIRLRASQPHLHSPTNDQSSPMILESQQPEVLVPATDHVVSSIGTTEATSEVKESVMTRLSPAHQQLSGPKSSNSLRFLLSHLTSHRSAQDCPESDRRGPQA